MISIDYWKILEENKKIYISEKNIPEHLGDLKNLTVYFRLMKALLAKKNSI
jgi:hypothetical protein